MCGFSNIWQIVNNSTLIFLQYSLEKMKTPFLEDDGTDELQKSMIVIEIKM